MLLADVVSDSADVGAGSRARLDQLGREAHWLGQLLSAYDEATTRGSHDELGLPAGEVSVDALTSEVLSGLRLTSTAKVQLTASSARCYANRLGLWRALRNLLDNAFRAAGQDGQIDVAVFVQEDRDVVIQIDDDGPGFGAGPKGLASLGLGIVQDFVVESGGSIELRPSKLGGSCVRIVLPAITDASDRQLN